MQMFLVSENKMATASAGLRWIDVLENQFDKSWVDLDLILNQLADVRNPRKLCNLQGTVVVILSSTNPFKEVAARFTMAPLKHLNLITNVEDDVAFYL